MGQGLEGSGQQVDEGGGYEDACAKVSGDEEELVGDGDRGKALDDDWEGAGCGRSQRCESRPKLE